MRQVPKDVTTTWVGMVYVFNLPVGIQTFVIIILKWKSVGLKRKRKGVQSELNIHFEGKEVGEMNKILTKEIDTCYGCSNNRYRMAGDTMISRCSNVNPEKELTNPKDIPTWCPLPNVCSKHDWIGMHGHPAAFKCSKCGKLEDV